MKKKAVLKRIFITALVVIISLNLFGCLRPSDPNSSSDSYSGSDSYTDSSSEDGATDQTPSTSIPAGIRPEDQEASPSEAEIAEQQKQFSDFIDSTFKETIEESYFATHIYYIDPEASGLNLSNVEITFGKASTDSDYAEMREYYKALADEFSQFNRAALTPEQQVEYDSFKWELSVTRHLSDEKFDYYAQYFAPPNSLDANLVSNLSNWDLRHERDVKDVITLLNSIPEYVSSHLEYAKKQQEMELFMTDFDVIIENCEDIIATGMDSIILRDLLEQVDEMEYVDQTADEYKSQITEAFQNSYLPSFQIIIDGMNDMRDGYNNLEGYAAFPHGAEYYSYNLMYTTGTTMSVEDINDYLYDQSNDLLNELMRLYRNSSEEVEKYYSDNPPLSGFSNYRDILEANKSALLHDHPEVKNLEYHIEDADPEEKLDEKNIAAYFLIPPLDGDRMQQMRVDPKGRDVNSLDTFITVSHEGFPGHMYHYAYMYNNIESDYIKTLGVNSFVEGYAVYAEFEALNYLKDLSQPYRDLIRVSTALSYADYSIIDIGINYYGWDLTATLSYFEDAGYSIDETTGKEIYDYLRCTPTSYIPYSYGYLRIADMRARAEAALGNSFNALDFNTYLLEPGGVPFEIIEKYIDAYIANQ